MSHFVALVIHRQPERPTEKQLGAALQPWHEYESTGKKDQYVTRVDVTAEVDKWLDTPERVECVRLADGELLTKDDPRASVTANAAADAIIEKAGQAVMAAEATGEDTEGINDQMEKDLENVPDKALPEGATLVKVSHREYLKIANKSRVDYVKEQVGYNYDPDANQFYRMTNPNAKWDWWSVGGRWTGYFKPNYDPDTDERNQETCFLCKGSGKREDMPEQEKCNGCNGTGTRAKWPTQWAKVEEDQVQFKDIPFAALRAEKEQKAAEKYDKVASIVDGREYKTFEQLRELHGAGNTDKARDEYWAQPVVRDVSAARAVYFGEGPEDVVGEDRATYIKKRGDTAGVPFAIVDQGKWYEKGEMGWWAVVSNEKDQNAWNEECQKLFASLDPNFWVTVVDCHI